MSKKHGRYQPFTLGDEDPGVEVRHVGARNAPPASELVATAKVPRDEPEIETLATLVLEKRGAQRRTRFIDKNGAERVTEWRDFDHGMYAQAAELRKAWTDELMEGVGRIPPGASRVYR